MIDDEFSPARLPMAFLGELLLNNQKFPLAPQLRVDELYSKLNLPRDDMERAIFDDHIEEMEELGLVVTSDSGLKANDRLGGRSIEVRLTPSGIYYCISRAYMFGEQQHGPTSDMSDRYSDLTFAIKERFSPAEDWFVPASDRKVTLSDNNPEVSSLHQKLDQIISSVASDNELGANNPFDRDEKIQQLRELKDALKTPEVRVSAIMYLGFQSLVWLAESFAEKPVGFLSEQAWSALKSIIGI